jgi:hypothetical protein
MNIEKIVRKHFQHVNKEGVGFLETNIVACIKELEEREQIFKDRTKEALGYLAKKAI